MPFIKVLSTKPIQQADSKLQAYRYQHLNGAIVCEPNVHGNDNARAMAAEEALDKLSFRVESRAQFLDGVNVYFDPDMLQQVFMPYNGTELKEQAYGSIAKEYAIHCDPALVNDFFSMIIAHTEQSSEPDEYGTMLKHLVVDVAKVWKPTDFVDNTIDYVAICSELKQYTRLFRPRTITMDQFNSAYILQELQQFANDNDITCNCSQFTATAQRNTDMYECLKLSINAKLVHSYNDTSWHDAANRCMLHSMLSQVQFDKGKISKPHSSELGHLDLCDCLAVLCYRLLGDQHAIQRSNMINISAIPNKDITDARIAAQKLAQYTKTASPMQNMNKLGRFFS